MDTTNLYRDIRDSKGKLLHIFENCLFTKGFYRTLVLDTQHKKIFFVPNTFFDFINGYNHSSLKNILKQQPKDLVVVEEYIDFILNNLLGGFFSSHEIKNFCEMSEEYISPYYFENAVVDIEEEVYKNNDVFLKLNKIGVGYLQIRFLDYVSMPFLEKIIKLINDLSFQSFALILKHDDSYNFFNDSYFLNNPKLENILIYNHNHNTINVTMSIPIIYTTLKNIKINGCGAVKKEYFSKEMKHVCQSRKFNTCLYKKIYIDFNGGIRNCPYSNIVFGNIANLNSEEVEKLCFDSEYTKLWTINKNQIDVCKDCEFRSICTDCRFFIKDTHNIYSQPAQCTYNPYICKWEGEDSYVPVEECGEYNIDKGFIINHKKIRSLNNIIYGE